MIKKVNKVVLVLGIESTTNMVHARNPAHHQLNIVIPKVLRICEDITIPRV